MAATPQSAANAARRVLAPGPDSSPGADSAPGTVTTSLAVECGKTSDLLSTKVGLLTDTNLRAFDTTDPFAGGIYRKARVTLSDNDPPVEGASNLFRLCQEICPTRYSRRGYRVPG